MYGFVLPFLNGFLANIHAECGYFVGTKQY
jgi:hypothetical protein